MVLVGEDPIPMIRHMGGKRITALHIHDNNYRKDMHTLPGNGLMEMAKIFETLKEVGYNGIYTMELTRNPKPNKHTHDAYADWNLEKFLSEALERMHRMVALRG